MHLPAGIFYLSFFSLGSRDVCTHMGVYMLDHVLCKASTVSGWIMLGIYWGMLRKGKDPKFQEKPPNSDKVLSIGKKEGKKVGC